MAGCNECKFNEGYLDDNLNLVHKCGRGFNDKTESWWKNNGTRKKGTIVDDMDCHEYTVFTQGLIDMIDVADEFLEKLKEAK